MHFIQRRRPITGNLANGHSHAVRADRAGQSSTSGLRLPPVQLDELAEKRRAEVMIGVADGQSAPPSINPRNGWQCQWRAARCCTRKTKKSAAAGDRSARETDRNRSV
jgi:hypothetical protein